MFFLPPVPFFLSERHGARLTVLSKLKPSSVKAEEDRRPFTTWACLWPHHEKSSQLRRCDAKIALCGIRKTRRLGNRQFLAVAWSHTPLTCVVQRLPTLGKVGRSKNCQIFLGGQKNRWPLGIFFSLRRPFTNLKTFKKPKKTRRRILLSGLSCGFWGLLLCKKKMKHHLDPPTTGAFWRFFNNHQ